MPPPFSLTTTTTTPSPSKRSRYDDDDAVPTDQRILMEPSEDCPWWVEVVAAVPQAVVQTDALNAAESVVQCGRWMAVVSRQSDNNNHNNSATVGYHQVHVWYTLPSQSLAEQKFSKAVLRVPLPKQWSRSSSFLPPLVALQSSATQQQPQQHESAATAADHSILLYVVHPIEGALSLWKLTTADLRLNAVPSCKTYVQLPLLRQDGDESATPAPAELVTCLSAHRAKYLLVGTSAGRVFWVRQNQHVLHVETLPYHSPNHSRRSEDNTGSYYSTLSRWVWGSSHATEENNNNDDDGQVDGGGNPFLTQALFWDHKNDNASSSRDTNKAAAQWFGTLTQKGQMVAWKAQRVDEYAPTTDFAPVTHAFSLQRALQQQLLGGGNNHNNRSVTFVQVLKAAVSPQQNVWHVLVRLGLSTPRSEAAASMMMMMENDDDDENHTESEEEDHEEQRLYWCRVGLTTTDTSPSATTSPRGRQPESKTWSLWSASWLDRFVEPHNVEVAGLQVAENGVAYAALIRPESSSSSEQTQPPVERSIPILMAHDVHSDKNNNSNTILYEVDLDTLLETSQLLGLFPDHRTHGCTLITSSGALMRAECKQATEAAATADTTSSMDLMVDLEVLRHPRKVASLLNHLRSTFWESYQHGPDRPIVLPPSIERAEKSDLETAIVKLGLELQKNNTSSFVTTAVSSPSSNLVMTWHFGLLDFLQRAGMYRSLMALSKWHLLAIGQEVAAYQAVAAASKQHAANERMAPFLESLTSHGLAVWLEGVQSAVLQQGGEDANVFATWLERAVGAAFDFRSERCTLTYDISSAAKPPTVATLASVPLWLCKPTLQKVLHTQLSYWKDALKPQQQQEGGKKNGSIGASKEQVEVVVVAALRSYCDSYLAVPSDSTRIPYAKMKSLAIEILRQVNGKERDALAWSLCKEHAYYWGLCQIAHDHRKSAASTEFNLKPLFAKFEKVEDISTGYEFGKYVIRWHIERNLLGEALEHGKNCMDDLFIMINSEPSLRPYRWIVSVQRGDFESATRNLVEVVDRAGPDITLAQAQFNLAMAKLANKVVLQQSVPHTSRHQTAQDRAASIENAREVAQLQQALLANEDANNSSYPWTAETLLAFALKKVDRVKDLQGKVETCCQALLLCAALDATPEQQQQEAAKVWFKAVQADWDFISQLLTGKTVVTLHDKDDNKSSNNNIATEEGRAHAILQKCVFGKLVEACDRVNLTDEVVVGIDAMIPYIVEHFSGRGTSDQSSMHRLLHAVVASSQQQPKRSTSSSLASSA